MRVIFAAGGTAGHINPALAVADKIKEVFPESEIMFIGTPRGLESKLVKKAGYEFSPIEMSSIQRSLSPSGIKWNVKAIHRFLTAKKKAKKIISEFKPDLVMGTGGYVTPPVVLAGAKLGIKTATHESNTLPGISTKLIVGKVDKVFLGTKDSLKYLPKKDNYFITGNPLRSNIKALDKQSARKSLGLPDGFTILSYGGSQGASSINRAVVGLLKWEKKQEDINHIHSYGVHGKQLFEEILQQKDKYLNGERTKISEYIHNMYTCISSADVIIARAGAMTITELQNIGRASILIPYPNAAENHQYYNAVTLAKADAAVVIEDKDLSEERLIKEVSRLYKDRKLTERMGGNAKNMAVSNAADVILSEIINLLGK